MRRQRGFTILELIVAIAIIGLLAAIIIAALDDSRQRGRDANRASQAQEFLKAFELYYTENGAYPDDGVLGTGQAVVLDDASTIASDLMNAGFLTRVPADPSYNANFGYRYCASDRGNSMALLVNTERDKGGTNYCVVSRGPAAYADSLCSVPDPTGFAAPAPLSSIDLCSSRF